ncbi:MAG TPA: PAS domain-containing protein [Flavisolibacter sp.]|jgi:PAS domain-containing protein
MDHHRFDIDKIEASPLCISVYNKALDIILWNKTCEEHFRLRRSEVLGKNLFSLFPFIEDDYRVKCLRSAFEGRSYFFRKIPYRFSKGLYTQYILPYQVESNKVQSVLNIIQNLNGVESMTSEQIISDLSAESLLRAV